MSMRILLVEDEVLIALQVESALEEAGFVVIGPCQSVAQALARLDIPNCCDAAVLDANLRNESADPVAKALSALRIPFVVTTGYDLKQLHGELATRTVLSKPFSSDELIMHLRQLLSAC